jgi:hypothetical protein
MLHGIRKVVTNQAAERAQRMPLCETGRKSTVYVCKNKTVVRQEFVNNARGEANILPKGCCLSVSQIKFLSFVSTKCLHSAVTAPPDHPRTVTLN